MRFSFFLVPAAFFGVHGKDKHEDVEGVSRGCYIKDIGIGEIEQFFTDACNTVPFSIANGVVPFKDIAFCFPAQKIKGVAWRKEAEVLFNAAQVATVCK